MNVLDALQGLWQGLLDITAKLVIPDWGALIGLLPIFLVLLVLGPLLSLIVLGWLIYFVRKPRAPIAEVDTSPVAAPIGSDGTPDFPRGEPFCYRDGLIYPANAHRCDTCGDELTVRCPKCEVARSASVDTCGNCGLVLKVRPQAQVIRAVQPPPGGAAAA